MYQVDITRSTIWPEEYCVCKGTAEFVYAGTKDTQKTLIIMILSCNR